MIIESIAILSLGLVMFFVSLPLVCRKVPMNPVYGIRIPAAFVSEQHWYEINAYGGRQMAGWAWLIIAAGIAGFFLPNDAVSIYLPLSTVVVLLAILIPIVRISQWARRLRPETASQTSTLPSGEIARAAEMTLKSRFLKKRTVIPAIVLGLLCLGYLIFIGYSAQWLPPRIATHFGASGRPNGWMPRESYLHFTAILGMALAAFVASLGVVLSMLQPGLKSGGVGRSPGRTQNLSFLCGDIFWFACLLLCFIAGTHYLVIDANRSHPAHLPPTGFALLIAGFIVANIAWTLLLCYHLMKRER